MSKIEPWSWVVLAASFMSVFMTASMYYSVGVIHIALLERYPDEDATVIAWLGSLFSSMMMLSSVLGSVVINMFNAGTCVSAGGMLTLIGFTLSAFIDNFNLLFLTFGFIAGTGQSLAYTGSMVVVGYWFKERTGMATGIITSASGLSIVVFPTLSQFLLDVYGLPGTFLLLGAFGFHSVIFGAVMRPTKYEKHGKQRCCTRNREKDRTPEKTEFLYRKKYSRKFDLLSMLPYHFLLLGSFLAGAGLSTVYLFLPDYFKTTGSTSQEAAFIFSITGISGSVSRILLGLLSTTIDPVLLYGGTYGLTAIATIFVNLMTSMVGKFSYSILFGLYSGACWTLQHAVNLEIVGLSGISTAYGINQLAMGVGYVIGPPLIGLVAENLNNQYYKFVGAAALFMFATLVTFAIRLVKKPAKKYSERKQSYLITAS